MRVDLGNCLADVASPGVSRDALSRLDEHVATAHDRIEARRAAGEFGYAALSLPDSVEPERISRVIEPVDDATAVLSVGIGGSALGAATVTNALGGTHYVLDNVDPDHVTGLLDVVPLDDAAIHVVSRSGETMETLANFLVVRDAMEAAGVDWTTRTVVTTGDSGPLRRLADRHDLPSTPVPDGVPGRFSVLSSVGLIPAAVLGHDVEAILEGAASESDRRTDSLFESPAYAYGAAAEALARRGAVVNAMMPYAESLEAFAEWFAQLWAESLGKDGLGQTPARALGTTDQHSQLQLYRAGRRNALVTFVRPRERGDVAIPDTSIEGLEYLGDSSLGTLIDAEFAATEASLAEAGRPTVRVEIERTDEAGIGELLYGMEAACVMAGELAGVETFAQPAVDWGKEAARSLLRGEDTPETGAVEEKTTLWIE